MVRLVFIFIGGGLGTLARYGAGRWAACVGDGKHPEHWVCMYPVATLGVNVLGSLAIGAAWGFAHGRTDEQWWTAPLIVGVLGGFTTFSAFSLETLEMVQDKRVGAALGYALGSVALGLSAVWAGYALVTKLSQGGAA